MTDGERRARLRDVVVGVPGSEPRFLDDPAHQVLGLEAWMNPGFHAPSNLAISGLSMCSWAYSGSYGRKSSTS